MRAASGGASSAPSGCGNSPCNTTRVPAATSTGTIRSSANGASSYTLNSVAGEQRAEVWESGRVHWQAASQARAMAAGQRQRQPFSRVASSSASHRPVAGDRLRAETSRLDGSPLHRQRPGTRRYTSTEGAAATSSPAPATTCKSCRVARVTGKHWSRSCSAWPILLSERCLGRVSCLSGPMQFGSKKSDLVPGTKEVVVGRPRLLGRRKDRQRIPSERGSNWATNIAAPMSRDAGTGGQHIGDNSKTVLRNRRVRAAGYWRLSQAGRRNRGTGRVSAQYAATSRCATGKLVAGRRVQGRAVPVAGRGMAVYKGLVPVYPPE